MTPFLPMLRADFKATESYHRALVPGHERVLTPTLLICGSADDEVLPHEVNAWQPWLALPQSRAPVQMDGDHFYVIDQPRTFISHILRHNIVE